MSSVVGVVMARDEWPLLGLSIVHHLSHVDRIVVLDHSSTDGTADGLARLSCSFGERLSVVRVDDVPFVQEDLTNLAVRLGTGEADWVYVFDGDEFVLPPDGVRLADLLAEAPDDVDAVRYEVANWVSPAGFDEHDLGSYGALVHRSVPSVFARLIPELAADTVERGHLNYFDLPFDSKVIARARRRPWIAAGSHLVHAPSPLDEWDLRDRLLVGHLPLLTRRRLTRKAEQGEALVAQGFPASHGWQNQMVHRLARSGRLDTFWAAHTVGDPAVDTGPWAAPEVVADARLGRALQHAADEYSRLLDAHADAPTGHPAPTTEAVPLRAALGTITDLRQLHAARLTEIAGLHHRVADLLTQVDELPALRRGAAELDTVRRMLVSTKEDLERAGRRNARLAAELDAARASLDTIGRERDRLSIRAEADAVAVRRLTADLDAAEKRRLCTEAELSALRRSWSWRITAPLRRFRRRRSS